MTSWNNSIIGQGASAGINAGKARCSGMNKIDLGPLVSANLDVMEADALRMRVKPPFVFTNLKSGEGVDQIVNFIIDKGGLTKAAA